uniref:Uncharacterized protein n=1 Tax=Rhizophora mucronata TaxID=61149 RepID=A0A2P2PG33_RHIMU
MLIFIVNLAVFMFIALARDKVGI